MSKHYCRRISAMLFGIAICLTGCSSTSSDEESANTAETNLTSIDTEETTSTTQAETEETTSATLDDPLYTAQVYTYDFPEEYGTLQTMRVCEDNVYVLSYQETDQDETVGVLLQMNITDVSNVTYTPLFPGADDDDFAGLQDFDVLSNGTICGLICDDATLMSYVTEGEEDTYTQDTASQYHLVWYNADGSIVQKLGLSTLLDDDIVSTQTVIFTSIHCDNDDQIYLTAVIDDQNYVMALDDNETLCVVQGSGAEMLEIDADYQWISSASEGILLLEEGENATLYHLTVENGVLWGTEVTMSEEMPTQFQLAESQDSEISFGITDDGGIYAVPEKGEDPVLLYTWEDADLDIDDVHGAILLCDGQVILTYYTDGTTLAIEILEPQSDEETETESEQEAQRNEEVPAEAETDEASEATGVTSVGTATEAVAEDEDTENSAEE